MELSQSPGVNFINIFTHSFCACRFQKYKKTDDLSVFFTLLGSAHVKVEFSQVVSIFLCFWDLLAQKLLVDYWWNWDQASISSTFYEQLLHMQIPKMKNTVRSSVSFYAFGIYMHKSCTQNVDEIEPCFHGPTNQGENGWSRDLL